MRAYANMPMRDFVDQIHAIALKAGAKPLVMDMIDQLADTPSADEIEEDQAKAVEEAEDEARTKGRAAQHELTAAAEDEGDSRGRRVMWEFCFDAVDDALQALDLPEETRDAVLQVLTKLEPGQ